MKDDTTVLKSINIINSTLDRTNFSFKKNGLFLMLFSLIIFLADIAIAVIDAFTARYGRPFSNIFSAVCICEISLLFLLFILFRFKFIRNYEIIPRKLLDIHGIGLLLPYLCKFLIIFKNQPDSSPISSYTANTAAIYSLCIFCLILFVTFIFTDRKSLILPAALCAVWAFLIFFPISKTPLYLTPNQWPALNFYITMIINPKWIILLTTGLTLFINIKKSGRDKINGN